MWVTAYIFHDHKQEKCIFTLYSNLKVTLESKVYFQIKMKHYHCYNNFIHNNVVISLNKTIMGKKMSFIMSK